MDEAKDFEQLRKKIEWLDGERRSDKTTVASLRNKMASLEADNNTLAQRIKQMESEITRLTTLQGGQETYENRIEHLKKNINQKIKEDVENLDTKQTEQNKQIKLEIDAATKTLNSFFTPIESIKNIHTQIKNQKSENLRLNSSLEEIKQKINDVSQFDEDYKRSLHLTEENLRQDAKRISDLQGEVIAQRKRLEENRSRLDLTNDNFRQIDNRINELQSMERDRKEIQSAFIDKINLLNIERDRLFKEWKERFDKVEKINLDLESQLSELENTHKAVNKSIAGLDDITNRFDRRINEITEINRLNDERFRQEWTAYKSDDQKRWTNYILGQEEQHRDMTRQLEATPLQIKELSDAILNIQDNLNQITQDSIKRFQTFLKTYQESILIHSSVIKR
ncbi:MAG: hypothetical protein MUO40_02665 [Anaerolineaceae bacterium]|nr:hypothetical protein [Anaerolineaceae bacterium]